MKNIKILVVMLAGLIAGSSAMCSDVETDKGRGFLELGRSVLRLDIMDVVEHVVPTIYNMRKSLTADCAEIMATGTVVFNSTKSKADYVAQQYVVTPGFAVVGKLYDYVPTSIIGLTDHGVKIGSLVYLLVMKPDEVRAKLEKTE